MATTANINGWPTAAMPLAVNYRASWGFGKAFANAGDKEHAGKIHDGLLDGIDWAIREKIAQPDKVAIMGWYYGGYSAFVGATFTPEVFCCAVPVVGITDLVTLMQNRPPYWADFMEQFNRRYADVKTEEGRALLRSYSPLHKVDQIKKPMLIGHGANDVRCTLAQSYLLVAAMQEKPIPVIHVVFPDEGHGFYRPQSNIAFHAIVEAFLARHLGGHAEPIGDDFKAPRTRSALATIFSRTWGARPSCDRAVSQFAGVCYGVITALHALGVRLDRPETGPPRMRPGRCRDWQRGPRSRADQQLGARGRFGAWWRVSF